MWKNIIERDPIQMTILHMRIAWWIIKATKTLVINNNYCFSTSTVVTSTHCVIRTLPVFVFMFCWPCISVYLSFCWPCISVYLSFCRSCILVYLSQYLTSLMHKICFTISFISRLYNVSSTCARNMYGREIKVIVKQVLCIKLVKYSDKCRLNFSCDHHALYSPGWSLCSRLWNLVSYSRSCYFTLSL